MVNAPGPVHTRTLREESIGKFHCLSSGQVTNEIGHSTLVALFYWKRKMKSMLGVR